MVILQHDIHLVKHPGSAITIFKERKKIDLLQWLLLILNTLKSVISYLFYKVLLENRITGRNTDSKS